MIIRIILILAVIFISFVGGIAITLYIDTQQMGEYDLYNCIHNNAEINNYNQHPIMVKRIQDECICFRENNYTNLLEADC